jgi:hypothetical protein
MGTSSLLFFGMMEGLSGKLDGGGGVWRAFQFYGEKAGMLGSDEKVHKY